jgi:DNA-binding CsgD family transcriptional regulator
LAEAVFIGRGAELGLLESRLELAWQGSPQIVAVEGEEGIGKTSLVREFAARAGQKTVFWCNGDEDETDVPWGMLRQLAEEASGHGDTRLRELVDGLHPGADPSLAGAGLLRLIGEDTHAVVVMDDVELADRQSMRALRFAFRRLVSEKVLVVMTYRPDRAARLGEEWRRLLHERGTRTRLGGLSPLELSQLSEALTGQPLSERGAFRLHAQTAGYPLFACLLLEQVPLSAIDRGDGPLPAPRELADAVADRLLQCSPAGREVLSAAAVLGSRCDLGVLKAVSAVEGFDNGVEEAFAARLLQEADGNQGNRLDFSHPMVRSAVYYALSPVRRRELHARAGSVLPGRAGLAHRVAATYGSQPALASELENVAEADMAAGHFAFGGQGFRSALRLSEPGQPRLRRLLLALEALLLAGDATGATELATELDAAPEGPWVDYVKGYLACSQARVSEAAALLTSAWARLRQDVTDGAPDDLRARVATLLAVVAILRIDYQGMESFGEEAVLAGSSKNWVVAFAWFVRIIGMAVSGRAPEALRLAEKLDLPGESKVLDGLTARGITRLWTDDLQGAHADLRRAVNRAKAGEPLKDPLALGYLGEVSLRLGRLKEAVVHTELAVQGATEGGRDWELPVLCSLAAQARTAKGDWAEAARHLNVASDWAEIMATPWARAYAAAARALLAEAQGDVGALYLAAERLEDAYDSREPGTHGLGPVLGRSLLALGRLDEADRAIERFEAVALASGRRSARMAVAAAKGQLAAARGDWTAAGALFEEAVQIAVELMMPLAAGLNLLAFGQSALHCGKRNVAVRQLLAAKQTLESIEASAYAGRAGRLLQDMGVTTAPAGDAGLLTATEGAVASLVGEGLSNAEVAQRMVVSEKAVEYHLTRIYAKLGITSRRQLAARLGAGG